MGCPGGTFSNTKTTLMEKLLVIKIGGNIIDDETKLSSFIRQFASIKTKKILVHGGGKLATRVAEAMGIKQQLIEGRRITDVETLKVVTMVYAGAINKNIVALLQEQNSNAIGITGADGNTILAHKRQHPSINYGLVGDIDKVNDQFLNSLLQQDLSIVIAPLTHDGMGGLLNTNADTIAQEIAKAMSTAYKVQLLYCFEKNGVLADTANDDSTIQAIDKNKFEVLKANGNIHEGMLPKLHNAFAALDAGVAQVSIGNALYLEQLINQQSGTQITK
jgi:acetylglutamate kinase